MSLLKVLTWLSKYKQYFQYPKINNEWWYGINKVLLYTLFWILRLRWLWNSWLYYTKCYFRKYIFFVLFLFSNVTLSDKQEFYLFCLSIFVIFEQQLFSSKTNYGHKKTVWPDVYLKTCIINVAWIWGEKFQNHA